MIRALYAATFTPADTPFSIDATPYSRLPPRLCHAVISPLRELRHYMMPRVTYAASDIMLLYAPARVAR